MTTIALLVALAVAVGAAAWATYQARVATQARDEVRRQLAGILGLVDQQAVHEIAIRELRHWVNPHSRRARAPVPDHLREAVDRLQGRGPVQFTAIARVA